jgi:hypothetical protein
MYNLRIDPAKNRLYVTLTGFFTPEEMKKCVDETILATKKLKTGYDVITDISQFKPGVPEVAKEIERAQTHFSTSGVGRGLRVVGHAALTAMQFSRTGKQAGYNSNNVATMEEAEKILDKPA